MSDDESDYFDARQEPAPPVEPPPKREQTDPIIPRLTDLEEKINAKGAKGKPGFSMKYGFDELRNIRGSKILEFTVPGDSQKESADNWLKFNWHLNGGLYTVNKSAIDAAIFDLDGGIRPLLEKGKKGVRSYGYNANITKDEIKRLEDYQKSKAHLEEIKKYVYATESTYYYFPQFKVKCEGAFTYEKKTAKILNVSKTEGFTVSQVASRPKPTITALFDGLESKTVKDFKAEYPDNQDRILFNYKCEFLSCSGQCGIIQLIYLYIYPEKRIGNKDLYKQSFLLTDSIDVKSTGVSVVKPDEISKFTTNDKNLYTVDGFSTLFSTTLAELKIKIRDLAQTNYLNAEGLLDPKITMQENNQVRNELEVLYFFNDELNMKKSIEKQIEADDNKDLTDQRQSIIMAAASIFNRLNLGISEKASDLPDVSNFMDKSTSGIAANSFNPMLSKGQSSSYPSQSVRLTPELIKAAQGDYGDLEEYQPDYDVNYGGENDGRRSSVQQPGSRLSFAPQSGNRLSFAPQSGNNVNFKGGKSIDRNLQSFTKCTNPLFKRSNIVGKFLMNLRKMRRNKPMRRRKTKRNNKSKRRNKKSKRRQ